MLSIIRELSDGKKVRFDGLPQFDGHIKVHLAADGPDYNVILFAGKVGMNSSEEIIMDNITVCVPY